MVNRINGNVTTVRDPTKQELDAQTAANRRMDSYDKDLSEGTVTKKMTGFSQDPRIKGWISKK